MAVRPNTPPVPGRAGSGGRPPGGGGNLRRVPSAGPKSVRPVLAGSVRPGNPTPPPSTPFQPGAPPSPPLLPIQALLGGLLLLGSQLWPLLNRKGSQETKVDQPFRDVLLPGGSNRTISWSARTQRTVGPTVLFNGSVIDPGNTVTPVAIGGTFVGIGVRVGATQGISRDTLGGVFNPGTTVMALQALTAAGPGAVLAEVENGRTNPTGFTTRTVTDTVTGLLVSDGTNSSRNVEVLNFQDPEQVRGKLGPDERLGNGETAPALVPVPVPLLPAAVPDQPDGQPVPVPAPVPGGLPAVSPTPGRRPAAPAVPAARPGPVPQAPAAVPITAGGVQTQPPPAQLPTNPGTTFLPGGRPLAPNGPPATMQGIATELGKLEQKLEIMLNPDDSLSPLELLNKVIDQVENIEFLIERLFPQEPYRFEPGAYELAPICDRDSEGDLIEPLRAPWAGGEGEFTELRQRLDALAQLMQHHKTLKQPTCGGRGSGPASNVTVHFESD